MRNRTPAHQAGFLKSSIVMLGVLALCAGMTLLGFELYQRSKSTQVVSRRAEKKDGRAVGNPEELIRWTSRGRRLTPNTSTTIKNHYLSKRDIEININDLGFRDKTLESKKLNEVRILVLGDSITWGDYLQADEVYVERIAAFLGPLNPHKTIEVINAGVGNIGTRDEISILEENVATVKPDIVILAFYLNDSIESWDFSRQVQKKGWLRNHSVLADAIYRNVKLYFWRKEQGQEKFNWWAASTRLDWKHSREAFLELVHMARFDWGAAWQVESWKEIQQHLDKLRLLSRQHHFDVAVICMPVKYQVYSDFLEDFPQRTMRDLATARGFAYYDLLPDFRNHNNEELFYDHCHPVLIANNFMGRAVAEFLEAKFFEN